MTKIYSVKKKHYDKLANFLSNFENATKKKDLDCWYGRFALWWDNNPAFSEDLLRGFILDCDGRIEGFYGFIPSFFQLSGKQIRVFNGTTWRVNKKFRGINGLKLIVKAIDYAKESIYFAGIWKYLDFKKNTSKVFSIITKPAINLLKEIHERMPVALSAEESKDYLDHNNSNYLTNNVQLILDEYLQGLVGAYLRAYRRNRIIEILFKIT